MPCDPKGSGGDFAEDYYFGPHLGLQNKYYKIMQKTMNKPGLIIVSKYNIIKNYKFS